ncbi:MAG: AAA family ATPase [Candidatus Accumulibacter sp.]|jgi:predicted ATPase|nr:AAA family ATPase [Accumulibacter sp.]
MKSDGLTSSHFLLEIGLKVDEVASFDEYPFSLPVVRHFRENTLSLHPKLTFFVGENGSGKSTLLEAIAIAWGLNPEGGTRNFGFSTRNSHSTLYQYLRMARGYRRAKTDFFLRAESFYNVASAIDGYGVADSYGSRSLHEQSHGESFFALVQNRFTANGFYILDEPEAALSPVRQLALLARLHELLNQGSQFIIATHSPILMAYPDAVIYQIDENGVAATAYEATEHYLVTQAFLNDPKRQIERVLE